jgi:hypothetical protein
LACAALRRRAQQPAEARTPDVCAGQVYALRDVLAKLTAMAAKEPKTIPVLRALEKGIGKGAGVLAAKKKED